MVVILAFAAAQIARYATNNDVHALARVSRDAAAGVRCSAVWRERDWHVDVVAAPTRARVHGAVCASTFALQHLCTTIHEWRALRRVLVWWCEFRTFPAMNQWAQALATQLAAHDIPLVQYITAHVEAPAVYHFDDANHNFYLPMCARAMRDTLAFVTQHVEKTACCVMHVRADTGWSHALQLLATGRFDHVRFDQGTVSDYQNVVARVPQGMHVTCVVHGDVSDHSFRGLHSDTNRTVISLWRMANAQQVHLTLCIRTPHGDTRAVMRWVGGLVPHAAVNTRWIFEVPYVYEHTRTGVYELARNGSFVRTRGGVCDSRRAECDTFATIMSCSKYKTSIELQTL